MPTLDELYPGAAPPSPTSDWLDAPDCLVGRHDAILVLGCPSEQDGSPSECQQGRVAKAIALSEAGYGDTFITSGAAVANDHLEAAALRDLLVAGGVPSELVFLEPRAEHTDENLYYSGQLMLQQGWQSALVVSEPEHLLYTAVCDADCCVQEGRLSTFAYPTKHGRVLAATYVLYPAAPLVTNPECDHLKTPTKLMCTQLSSRRACAADFQL